MSGWMDCCAASLLAGLIFFPSTYAFSQELARTDAAATTASDEPEAELFQPWLGAPEIPASEPGTRVEPKPQPNIIAVIDAQRDILSEKIVAFTKGVDEFFGDERYFQEYNKSVIQLNFNQTIAQGGSRPFSFEGQAKLDLPAAQRRFQFVLEVNPAKKTAGEVKKDQPATPQEAAVPEKYAASLRYEKSEESLWHFSSDAGIQFQFPLDPFVRTRGSYALQIEEWRLKLTESVFWFSTIGLGETSQFDMERVLSNPVLFRATSTATCFEAPQRCDLRQDLSFYHTLNERTAVVYQASVIGTNKPMMQETAYVLLMRYRYRLHKEWVFFEVSPQLNFPKTDDFRLNALLLLRLEILFGGTR